ncbi:MAG: 4a-hydroxytetrahydrobiopterin dehydratase [Ferruginibacter sp.]
MNRIFISYRRTDSSDTNRVVNFLRREIGADKVFIDREMSPGTRWPDSIKKALAEADVMLLIIGPNWLFLQDEMSGKRRIDLETDWVRQEITTFLKLKSGNKKLELIPVLVNGAKMPNKEYLDDELDSLCDFQSFNLGTAGEPSDFAGLRTLLKKYGFSVNPPPVVTPIKQPLPPRLTEEEENEFLSACPGWRIVQSERTDAVGEMIRELYRLYEFKNYEEAWKFMLKVDENVIRYLNHHPKWQNTWNRVEFWICTFNIEYELSQRDIKMARMLEQIWDEFAENQQ